MLDVCHVPSPVSSHLCFLGVGHPLAAFLLYRFSFLEDPSMWSDSLLYLPLVSFTMDHRVITFTIGWTSSFLEMTALPSPRRSPSIKSSGAPSLWLSSSPTLVLWMVIPLRRLEIRSRMTSSQPAKDLGRYGPSSMLSISSSSLPSTDLFSSMVFKWPSTCSFPSSEPRTKLDWSLYTLSHFPLGSDFAFRLNLFSNPLFGLSRAQWLKRKKKTVKNARTIHSALNWLSCFVLVPQKIQNHLCKWKVGMG